MKEQQEEEGVMSTNDEETDEEGNNIHDNDEEENENEETMEDESIDGENNSISVSRSTLRYRMQKLRAKAKLINTLLSINNFSDQCSVLKSFLYSPQLKEHVKELQIDQTEERIKIESFDNLAEIMLYSSPKKKGNIKFRKKGFYDYLVESIVGTTSTDSIESNVNDGVSQDSRSKRFIKNKYLSKAFSFSKRTLQRKVKRGIYRRDEIMNNISPKSWCMIPVKTFY